MTGAPRARPAASAARASRGAPADADVPRGLLNDVVAFSWVDGPGNRFAVFLQGCNMDCVACHNPHTIRTCDDCAACVSACGAASLDVVGGAVRWTEATCLGCDDCVAACPSASTPKTRSVSASELVAEVRAAAPYLSGVTVSGGEATQQVAFVAAFFAALANDPATAHLTRFVDSNGLADGDTWARLERHMDAAMIDLKAWDDDVHRSLTGTSNAAVRASIARLAAGGRLHEVRLLMLPGRNDAAADLDAVGAWLAELDPDVCVKLIGFRRHGVRAAARTWPEPTADDLAGYAARLAARGLHRITAV